MTMDEMKEKLEELEEEYAEKGVLISTTAYERSRLEMEIMNLQDAILERMEENELARELHDRL